MNSKNEFNRVEYEFMWKNTGCSRRNQIPSAAEQFFSCKNPAVYFVNPRIFPLASAKNSQKHPCFDFCSVSDIFRTESGFNN